MGDLLRIRPGEPDDLPAIAEVYLAARQAAFPAIPAGAHPPDDVRRHVTGWDLTEREVWVAETEAALVGFAALTGDWLDHLYIAPQGQGRGVGSALLDLVKTRRPAGFSLWVFLTNQRARDFYHQAGLREVLRTDGSDNEEGAPDAQLAWVPDD